MSNLTKASKIKATIEVNRLRRASMEIKVFELKIDESHLSEEKLKKLNDCFIQAKWLYNHIIGLDLSIFEFDSKLKQIPVHIFNEKTGKCDIEEIRNLTIGSQIKQAIVDRAVQNVINLSKKKKKGGKIGRLRFKTEVNSVPLKQVGTTYKIKDSGKIFIQGVGELHVNGLDQIDKSYELANGLLIKKASGFFVKITIYRPKSEQETNGKMIGLDFGIKDSIINSEGNKSKFHIELTDNLRRQQHNLARKKKKSKRYEKQCKRIKKLHEKLARIKDDLANQFVHKLKKYEKVVIQDENISGWQSNHFGKEVQTSILGRIKARIKNLETSIVIDRFLPTTKLSPVSGKLIDMPLSERWFKDGDFIEDRDIKSAKTILALGLYKPDLTRKELMGLPEEELISIFSRLYNFEDKSVPASREATAL